MIAIIYFVFNPPLHKKYFQNEKTGKKKARNKWTKDAERYKSQRVAQPLCVCSIRQDTILAALLVRFEWKFD